MLLVTIELISANTHERSLLHQGVIYLDETHNDGKSGDYVFKLGRKGKRIRFAQDSQQWEGEVKGFSRKRLNAWHLLALVMSEFKNHGHK